MLTELLKKMAPEFGYLAEGDEGEVDPDLEGQIEKEVLNKLDKSSKLDEVETVTFGLETDDGKIVKVYVKAEQADDFEKALSAKLGEIDDIEEALNELSKEFEIIDVDWPDDENASADPDADPEAEDDGSEALNDQVFKKGGDSSTKPAMEGLTIGEIARFNLTEDHTTVESRLNTTAQMMVYHAIIELGIPEVALNRNPYRAAIIKGIRDVAYQLSKNAQMKQALKMFVKNAADHEKKGDAPDDEETSGSEKEEVKKGDTKRPPMIKDTSEEKEKKLEKIKESQAYLTEGVQIDFWAAFVALIKYISPDPVASKNFLSTSKVEQLMARSNGSLNSRVSAGLRMKMNDLVKAMNADQETGVMQESATPDEVNTMVSTMLMIADPSKDSLMAKNIIASSPYTQLMSKVKTKLSQKFNGQVRSKLNAFKELLDQTQAEMMKNAETPVTESKKLLEDQVEWTIEQGKDGLALGCGYLKMVIGAEDSEKLAKAMSNHDAIVIKDTEGKKYVFSPRGLNAQVKPIGSSTSYVLSPDDLSTLITAATTEPDESNEDESDKEQDAPEVKKDKKELDPTVAKKAETK